MKIEEVYNLGKEILKKAHIESYQNDVLHIVNKCFGMNRQDIILNKNKIIDEKEKQEFLDMINRRTKREPLQYIIGHWYFMDNKFQVGEGVLIPRDDTEVLVRKCEDYLCHIKNSQVIDLCSGSGIIAICLAKKFKDANIKAVELSEKAFEFLNKNIVINKANVKAYNEDIFKYCDNIKNSTFDLIVSNPPYIPTEDIKALQAEVLMEPTMALDGGKDGLYFYENICDKWISKLKIGGMLAVEIGINQSRDVIDIFKKYKLKNIGTERDINNIERIVFGIKV